MYLRAACTNPGFLIGCSQELAARAGAYDPKNFEFTTERKEKEPQNLAIEECSLDVVDPQTVRNDIRGAAAQG
jgi:hypothetical protein